jgi:IS4 transposase
VTVTDGTINLRFSGVVGDVSLAVISLEKAWGPRAAAEEFSCPGQFRILHGRYLSDRRSPEGTPARATPSKVEQKYYNLLPEMEIPSSQEAAAMVLGPVLERFIQDAPMPLIFRALLERALDPAELDTLFEATARRQYTRELLFSAIVDLLAVVVFRMQPSVRRAYLSSSGMMTTLTAVYEKLKGTEPEVCRQLVRTTTARLLEILRQVEGARPAALPGYTVTILDGHHLSGTEHRIPETRGLSQAILPGQSLVVLDADTGLVVDVVPCQDAHAQERTFVDKVLPRCAPGELWIEDRNFCAAHFVRGVAARGASFLVRQHANMIHVEPLSEYDAAGRVPTGTVAEQQVLIVEMDGKGRPRRDEQGQRLVLEARRVRIELDTPTQDGDTEVVLLSNLPGVDADAGRLSELDLKRWTIEHIFQTLTQVLRCEVNTLTYPGAALLGFCVAVVGHNVLTVIRAALRAEHGREAVDGKVSDYHVMCEVVENYKGMTVAVPPESWRALRVLSLGEFADFLREVASQVHLARYPLCQRRPKPAGATRRKRTSGEHLATARLLDQRKSKK